MLTHIVLVELKDGVTDTEVDAAVAGLAGLPEVIPEIRRYEVGRDAGLSPTRIGVALVARFDSVEDFATYRAHPAHKQVAQDLLAPIAASYTTSQLVTD